MITILIIFIGDTNDDDDDLSDDIDSVFSPSGINDRPFNFNVTYHTQTTG